jgi:CDP-diacylglycerol--serine O-phosphatidyltransferase
MQINLRKAMFVLPNLFTVSSIFLGFYALVLCSGEATPLQLYQAALAIFFAMFFDAFDGRVARMTKTQSDFGVQLDSLADVMSFGAAPALLVYKGRWRRWGRSASSSPSRWWPW